jgi:hypothetical protein
LDINILLEGEQVSLLRARFATHASRRDQFLTAALRFSDRLHSSAYPYRPLAHALLT